jgi:hypothetical protein
MPAAAKAVVRRHGLLVWLLAAAGLLILADFLVLRQIRVVTAVPPGGTVSGGRHHGYALALLGAASMPMAFGAVRGGSRPAAVALVVLGAAAAAVVALVDLPTMNETGLIGSTYELARAAPGLGFWIEAAGAAGLLGGALALLGRGGARADRRGGERPSRSAPAPRRSSPG